jgi:hypothetical protein
MLESEVEKFGDMLALKNGYYYRKLSYVGRTGAPDKMYYGKGRIFFIEYKKPKGHRRKKQINEVKRMKEEGIEVYFVDNMEDCRAVFERL